ncbi:MAG: 3-isopropylmalate dehydratase small subunit [Firmicutes bacterium]|nr:3-isopropylmalate dehydratase small subunit [Bacillota bacterium]
MEKFVRHTGVVAPLDRANVDTDQIIPKQFLKRIERTGFGKYLFFDWRYLESGEPNPDFVLNQEQYRGASILVARDNFGCGSSREHAPWALADYGFRVIIAPSFADIFYNNCFKNGMLPIRLSNEDVDFIMKQAQARRYELTVDLEKCLITDATDSAALSLPFTLDATRRERLLEGLDDIDITLKYEEQIRRYEEARRVV